jgi:hypothetical protein
MVQSSKYGALKSQVVSYPLSGVIPELILELSKTVHQDRILFEVRHKHLPLSHRLSVHTLWCSHPLGPTRLSLHGVMMTVDSPLLLFVFLILFL